MTVGSSSPEPRVVAQPAANSDAAVSKVSAISRVACDSIEFIGRNLFMIGSSVKSWAATRGEGGLSGRMPLIERVRVAESFASLAPLQWRASQIRRSMMASLLPDHSRRFPNS